MKDLAGIDIAAQCRMGVPVERGAVRARERAYSMIVTLASAGPWAMSPSGPGSARSAGDVLREDGKARREEGRGGPQIRGGKRLAPRHH